MNKHMLGLTLQWRGVYQELIIYSNAELPGALKAWHIAFWWAKKRDTTLTADRVDKGTDSRKGSSWTKQLAGGNFCRKTIFVCIFLSKFPVCFLLGKVLDDLSLSAQHTGGAVEGVVHQFSPTFLRKCMYFMCTWDLIVWKYDINRYIIFIYIYLYICVGICIYIYIHT